MKLKPKRRLRPLLAALTLILVAALAAGVTAYVKTRGEKAVLVGEQTQQAKAEVEALVSLSCAGTQIPCAAAEFSVLDLDDRMTTVTLRNSAPTPSVELSRFGDALVFARAPKSAEVVVTHGGAEVFRGTPEQFNASFRPAEDGVYDFAVTASMENISASGSASYAFSVTYKIVPVFALSRDSVPQGGALVVSGENLRASDALAVRVSFSYTPHIVRTETGFYCYIPFNYLRAPGEYTLEVECNGQTTQLPYTVTAVDYEEQHLVVDETTESTTIGDAEALAVYNSTIAGLDEIADDADYTTGLFQWPCEGEITTAFGAQRYINDAAQPSSIHAGIDIACAEGTPVAAANGGRVLYADFLQVSGWTVVIEHGGGLHTMYLHMSALNCKAGDMVARGDVIGAVGQTGFATGPHLHFQASVCGACISPLFLFDGSSGVYDLPLTDAA